MKALEANVLMPTLMFIYIHISKTLNDLREALIFFCNFGALLQATTSINGIITLASRKFNKKSQLGKVLGLIMEIRAI